MNWAKFLERLKTLGYRGDGEKFDEVQTWLKENGHDWEEISVKGEVIALKTLYDSRRGAKVDVTKEAADAEFEAKVEARVKDVIGRIQGAGLLPKIDAAGLEQRKAATEIEIKVGQDRVLADPKGGFPSFGRFIQAVYQTGGTGDRAFDPAPDSLLARWTQAHSAAVNAEAEYAFKAGLITKATLSTYSGENVGADGGFAVPPEFRTGIMKRIGGEQSIMALCDRSTLSGNSLTAAIDDTTPWQSTGGVLVYWLGEATAITQSKLALKDRNFRLRKVAALVPLSDELAQDAAFIESYIARVAGDKLGFEVDNAILNGNGVTRPTGVVGHAGTIDVGKESGQDAATIVARNIQKMWMRCLPQSRRTATWIANPDTQVELQRMFVQGVTDAGTNVAAGSLVYLPANGLVGQPNDTLMGRPIIYHQAAKTLGTTGDIILFDGQSYIVLTKAAGIETASSIHLWFDQAVSALRFLFRVEGQPWWPTTIDALNGSTTYASFVTLATRS